MKWIERIRLGLGSSWLGLLLLCFQLPVLGQSSAVQREWSARRLALEEPLQLEAIAALVQAPDWRQRETGWEALGRALGIGRGLPESLRKALQRALEDEHPGVRLSALECLSAAGLDVRLEATLARKLSQEAWPNLRMALVEALERTPCELSLELSQKLLDDEDERVAQRAERVFWGLEAGQQTSAQKVQVLQQRLAAGDPGPLRTALEWIWKSDPDPALYAALWAFNGHDPEASGAWGALGSALKLAHGARGNAADVERLLGGWTTAMELAALPEGLLWAASRSANPELARAWLRALDALERGAQAELPWPAWRSATRAEVDPKWACWSALVDCVGAARVAQLALELELGPGLSLELLEQVGPRVDSWDWLAGHPQALRWLGPAAPPALHSELLRACASTLFRTGDSAAGELLVRSLGEGASSQRELAFQALANDLDSGRWEAQLFAAWLPLGDTARARCAAWLPRQRALAGFREALIEWGDASTQRSQAVELLAAFREQPAVVATLLAWLQSDFERLQAPGASDPQGTWRTRELLVESELRALGKLLGSQAIPASVLGVLQSAKGLSEPVATAAVRALGTLEQGRAALLELGPEALDPVPLAEACIALLNRGVRASERDLAAPLIRGFEQFDGSLRVRSIQALGGASSFAALDFLKRVAGDGDDFSERVAALDALARLRVEGAAPEDVRGGEDFLRALIQGRSEVEYRRVALAALARAGSPETLLWLLQAGLAPREEQDLGPETPREDRKLLRDEVLIRVGQRFGALASRQAARDSAVPDSAAPDSAAMESLGELLAPELLRRPSLQAAARLEASFEGQGLGALEFEWRAELVLARELARAGILEQQLKKHTAIERLEGEFLLLLARQLEPGSTSRRRLLEAAQVALHGALHGARSGNARQASARARLELLEAAWNAGDFRAAARQAHGLRLDRRAGRIPRAEWTRALGSFDLQAESDPSARLRTTEYLSRSQVALALGDRQGAQAWLERAWAGLGDSAWARLACEKMRAKLQER